MAKKQRSRVHAVFSASEPGHLEALRSRLRGRICDVVYHAGSATVHEIADQLGKPVSSLYHHLDMLVEVGLLLEGEPVRTNKNFARTYTAPARRLKFTQDLSDPDVRRGIADVAASQLRLAEREFRAALETPGITAGKPTSRVGSGSMVGWLDDDQIRKVNSLVNQIAEIFDESVKADNRKLHAFTYASRIVGDGAKAAPAKNNL